MSVYFITAREVGRVKIGCAYEPSRRMATMQVGCPVELALEATLKGFHKEERAFHKRFSAHRLHGEWFTITPEIEALLAAAEPPPPRQGASQAEKLKHLKEENSFWERRRLIRELAALEDV